MQLIKMLMFLTLLVAVSIFVWLFLKITRTYPNGISFRGKYFQQILIDFAKSIRKLSIHEICKIEFSRKFKIFDLKKLSFW